MKIEVDMSGKVEQLNMDTVIAFSNHEEFCIKIPRKVKQEIVYEYKTKVRQIIRRLFAICVYYCIEDYIHKLELIDIDLEYPGWEADIKTYLIPLLRLKHQDVDKNIIQFNSIGRKSRAHKVAKSAYVGKTRPNKILKRRISQNG